MRIRKLLGFLVVPFVAALSWMPFMFLGCLVWGFPIDSARNLSGYGSWESFLALLGLVSRILIPASFFAMYLVGLPLANNRIRKGKTGLADFVLGGLIIGVAAASVLACLSVAVSSAVERPTDPSQWRDTMALATALVLTSTCGAAVYWLIVVKGTSGRTQHPASS